MGIFAVCRNVLLFLFGENNIRILYVLITLVSLDYITGVCCNQKRRAFQLHRSQGNRKKNSYFFSGCIEQYCRRIFFKFKWYP